ncbi:MAG TPA: NB-ARC domain-containing protein [Alphaproteobacteria bacterium]|nr:NB-ARC domain-containing protein [Alphaproteobacteria bacterium]HQS93984.1 NB-ARC domain-containing protein [Alphaproteobacteria bacterium]
MVKYDLIQNSSKQKYIQELSDVINNEKEENNVILQMKRLKKRKSLISIIALIMFIFGFYIGFLEVKKHQESQREMHLHSIRSNLMIPTENSFLKRPELIDQIDEKLKGDKGIETIALVGLVGMGGVGKTTLARYYARSKDNSIVWEINAETKSSIIHSFKDLAYTLAKTQNQREELDAIQKIKDTEIKEEQLISFVRDCLREHLNWLLIYDNVEKFSDIKNYFPQDPEAWGHGKVIITTRDSNIKNTNYIKPENVIELGELTKEGALILFGKILYNCDLNKLTQVQKEKMLDFLKEIPPFPLDVSLAAYYMRNENLSYDQYKERMNKFNADFEKSQENLVKETSSYTKTRYAIIISSLQKIIQLNPEYKELLFFICLVDSQAIPKKLLELHKNPVMIDRLLRELRNGSFVSEVMSERTEESIPSFFIHRSTQALSLNFLINSLSLEGRNNFTEKIISTMKNYYEEFSEGDNPKILMFIPHLESLLKNIDKINISKAIHEKCRVDLLLLLGYLHYQSKNFPLAKKYFEDVLEGPNNSSIISVKRLSEIEKDFGYICAELGEADKALIYLQKSIELCKQIPHSEILKAENIKTMGYVYSGKNDFLKSRQYFEEALEIISNIDKNLKKTLLEADIYAQLAILYSMEYLNKNEAYKAEDYALKSLKILKEAQFFYKDSKNDLKKISQRIEKHGWRLGQIYNRLGRYREAIKEFDTNKLSNKTSQNRLLISKGEASLRLGNLETADQSLTEAINMIEKSGKPNTWEPKVLRAEVKIRLGNFEEAYKDCSYILNAKTKKRNNYLNVLFITNFYHLGLIKCKQEKFKESTEYFSMFFEAIEKFCKSFLDEKIYNDLELKGVFQRVTYHESTVIQDIQGSLQRSTKIFSAIYGASHPFVCDYVLKNGEDFKKNPPLSLWKGLKNMFYIFFKNGSLCL